MGLSKNAVTGMRDILPREMELRDYTISLIKSTYKSFGFTPMETPVVESLGNLLSKQGGDNEKLIFKILKRGEKLKIDTAKTEEDLSDSGLRYDLTVPLVRYYSAHSAELPKPFKALQIGPVFRADRPQRGRFRQFYQCDIDILGEAGSAAETELLLATSTLLGKLGFTGFIIHINDRRILKAMAAWCGITPEVCDKAFITWDKMDKIGLEGVCAEMAESGFSAEQVEAYRALSARLGEAEDPLEALSAILSEKPEASAQSEIDGLKQIIADVGAISTVPFRVLFDPTLVRGMSYYTGPIFEIELADLGMAAGGGGRYDEMIGKFTGQKVPACGISIGFERLITILLEQGFAVPGAPQKKAWLIDKKVPAEKRMELQKMALAERAAGNTVLVAAMNKNKKFQKDQLTEEGYGEISEFYAD
ncbi:MAG: histidine--tRNA ligase [Lachnospiraceae bacterium]|nr:histidine--tRNA ligase [Lachnospiraceae bacterium]